MATNVYFSPKVKSEQNLYEDIVIESLKMYGQDMYYLPRTIVDRDFILNEPVESQFNDAYIVEMYVENTEGFGGEGDLMSKFGLEIRDTATFIVSRRRWEQTVGFWNNELDAYRPKEGDLIYLPLSKSFFQIDKVEHERPFYQLNNLPIYALQCSMFEFSAEDFNTGLGEIDRVEGVFAGEVELTIDSLSPNNNFLIGETLTQTTSIGETIKGTIASYEKINSDSAHVVLHTITTSDKEYREFVEGSVTSSLSGITGAISESVHLSGQSQESAADQFASNYEIEYEADSIIDFSEENPFGEIGNV